LGWANVYYGVAQRALDLTIASVKSKKTPTLTRTLAYHPEIQHRIAQMVLAYDTIGPVLDRVAEDWSNGVNHGPAWLPKMVSAKHHAVQTAWTIVDWAMDVSGGAGMFRGNELERLFRDARCGRFHPANTFLTHEIVAKSALGIEMGEQPRWG
jgi:alkylation response protein AidB-like acyl-CoA dehydrogenase